MASSFIVRWVAACVLGFAGWLGIAIVAVIFLQKTGVSGFAGAATVVALVGALSGVALGLFQGIVLRHHVPAWRWTLATAFGGGLVLLALGAFHIILTGLEGRVFDFVYEHATRFGTPQAYSDLNFMPPFGGASTHSLPLGIAEQSVLGAYWAAFGAIFGGALGLPQWVVLCRRRAKTAWPGWSVVGLAGGLVLGAGAHGVLRHIAGKDVGGLSGSVSFLWLPSLAVGIAIAVVVYGVVTGSALRSGMPHSRSNGVVFQK